MLALDSLHDMALDRFDSDSTQICSMSKKASTYNSNVGLKYKTHLLLLLV